MFIVELLFENPVRYAMIVGVVIVSVVLHELGHALAATWEGDATPRFRGHLTWNPVVHMGWMAIGAAALIGIAWGQTPVTPAYFRHRRWGETIVSFAGPAVNLGLAVLGALVLVLVERGGGADWILEFWWLVVGLNVLLFLLNMIPLPPLDGFTVARGFFSMGELGDWLRRMQPWTLIVALLIVTSGPFRAVEHSVRDALISVWLSILPGGA